MLDQRWRAEIERGLRPVGSRLRQAGFTADQITLAGLGASVATGIAIATGHLGWGAAFLFVSGMTDVLDGAVAKSGGTSGPRGSFFDSVADRVSDGVVLGGAAWFLAGGDDPRLSVLAFAVAVLSLLVSYERSKAEALGFNGKGGLMERAERMSVLGIGLTFGALIPALWLLFVLTSVTVAQRFLRIWRQATPPLAGEPRWAGWWLTGRPAATDDESRLVRWRWAANPPGDGAEPDRRRRARWLVSSRPPNSDPTRLARWWSGARPSGAGVRSQLRRLRGRTRP